MAILGKTTVGGTTFSVTANEYDSTQHVLSVDSVAVEMWVNCRNDDVFQNGFKLAIYTGVSNLPSVFKVATDEITLAASATQAWVRGNISTPVLLPAGPIHLGHMGYATPPSAGIKVFADTPGGNVGAFDTQTGYPNFDNPATTPSLDTVAYSIYVVLADIVRVDYSQFPKYKLRSSA